MKNKIKQKAEKIFLFLNDKYNAGLVISFTMIGVLLSFSAIYSKLDEKITDSVSMETSLFFFFFSVSYMSIVILFANGSEEKNRKNKANLFEDETLKHFISIENDLDEMNKKGFVDIIYLKNTFYWLKGIMIDNDKYFFSDLIVRRYNILIEKMYLLMEQHYVKEKSGISDMDFIHGAKIRSDISDAEEWIKKEILKSWDKQNKAKE